MRSFGSTNRQLVAIAVLSAAGVALVAGQQPSAPAFTAAQAATGRDLYSNNCASCHVADLGGRNEAPPLAGSAFMGQWRTRSTKDLFDFITATMPPGGSTLTDDQYLSIAAFILQS